METLKHLGSQVRKARRAAGLTQEQLAERVSKSVRTISNIESGSALTGLDTLHEISMVLQKPFVYFFEGAERTEQRAVERVSIIEDLCLNLNSMSNSELDIVKSLVDAVLRNRILK